MRANLSGRPGKLQLRLLEKLSGRGGQLGGVDAVGFQRIRNQLLALNTPGGIERISQGDNDTGDRQQGNKRP